MSLESGVTLYTTISSLLFILLLFFVYYLGEGAITQNNKLLYLLIIVGFVALVMYQRFVYIGLGEVFNDWLPTTNIARRMKCENDRDELDKQKKELEEKVIESKTQLEKVNEKVINMETQAMNEEINNRKNEDKSLNQ